jgi:phospholipid/cholesterol/gamma-HCH transport system substrate-binding protein
MEAPRERYRHVLLGAFVLIALGLFVLGTLQSNAVREWLNPSKELRLVMPDEGLFGLSQGAKIEILGTPAGSVTRIVIDPNEKVHAQARIDPSMSPFVRRDSKAIIRKTFGVAGESYVEITRGRGEPMDWDYAVLTVEADRAPTENIGEIMQELRGRVMPILAQTERAVTALAELTERLADPKGNLQLALKSAGTLSARIERGEGSLGRMLASDTAARELEALLGNANSTLQALGPILDDLRATSAQVASLSAAINAQSKDLPHAGENINSILESLERIMGDLRKSSPQLPQITRDVGTTTASVPVLLGTIQQTLTELDALLRKLRGHWLLGGGGAEMPPGQARLPPSEVRP